MTIKATVSGLAHGRLGGGAAAPTAQPEVSIVVPVYFNAESLASLYARIAGAMAAAAVAAWDVTFVDDGSKDGSRDVLRDLSAAHDNVRVVHLSRNFGSWSAITAGLGLATGRAVAVISADLQDPPELLADMVRAWREGTKVVVATRESRDDPWTSRLLSALFYRLFRAMVSSEMPPGGFDFFVVDRQVARLLVEHAEKNTTIPASLLWLGFERKLLPYHRAGREHGRSMWTFWAKFKLFYDSILSFSYVPLRLMTATGVGGMLFSLVYGALIIVRKLGATGDPPGWASLMVVTLFFDGLLLTSLGLVGEYVWRTFDAARRRPLFVVDRCTEPARPAALDVGQGEDVAVAGSRTGSDP